MPNYIPPNTDLPSIPRSNSQEKNIGGVKSVAFAVNDQKK
jgi:hypothetical protein